MMIELNQDGIIVSLDHLTKISHKQNIRWYSLVPNESDGRKENNMGGKWSFKLDYFQKF